MIIKSLSMMFNSPEAAFTCTTFNCVAAGLRDSQMEQLHPSTVPTEPSSSIELGRRSAGRRQGYSSFRDISYTFSRYVVGVVVVVVQVVICDDDLGAKHLNLELA